MKLEFTKIAQYIPLSIIQKIIAENNNKFTDTIYVSYRGSNTRKDMQDKNNYSISSDVDNWEQIIYCEKRTDTTGYTMYDSRENIKFRISEATNSAWYQNNIGA